MAIVTAVVVGYFFLDPVEALGAARAWRPDLVGTSSIPGPSHPH